MCVNALLEFVNAVLCFFLFAFSVHTIEKYLSFELRYISGAIYFKRYSVETLYAVVVSVVDCDTCVYIGWLLFKKLLHF